MGGTDRDTTSYQMHGTRDQFITSISERLLEKVNAEAGDLEQAKVLFRGYLAEFCDEYDRCGYGADNTTRN